MKTYGLEKSDRYKCGAVKGCTCCDWSNKYPYFISERKGNKNRARKKTARQKAKMEVQNEKYIV